MTWISDTLVMLSGLPLPVVLLAAAVLAFSETAIGFGMLLPGETGLLVMATTVDTTPEFVLMSLVVWLSAVAGDSFGYFLGRRYGIRIRDTRLLARAGRQRWDRTGRLFDRWGVGAVVLGRFVPGVRVLTPVAAGSFHVSYPRFLLASLAGALAWALAHVAAGAFAGASLIYIERLLGATGWVLLAAAVLTFAVIALRRRNQRRHRERAHPPAPPQSSAPSPHTLTGSEGDDGPRRCSGDTASRAPARARMTASARPSTTPHRSR